MTNDMNEAMERAARALYERRCHDLNLPPVWANLGKEHRRPYCREAKAAIVAFLRSAPVSEGMVWAGIEALDRCEKAMRDRNASDHPEDMPDYDQGDLVTQAHKAMSTQLADEIEGMSNGQ